MTQEQDIQRMIDDVRAMIENANTLLGRAGSNLRFNSEPAEEPEKPEPVVGSFEK
jgi:hypothetical protein